MGSLSSASADCTHCYPANMKDWERLIPAANMGEYEPPRERPEDGGLYPLNAEGTYGRVPKNRNPGRSSRATSAPPQSLAVTEVKEKSVEKSNRQASLLARRRRTAWSHLSMVERLKMPRTRNWRNLRK